MKVEFSAEEIEAHKKIQKEYTHQSIILKNREVKDLTDKICCQQEAIRALPAALQTTAKIIDETPPPSNRPWPKYDTPPIKDFDPRLYLDGEDTDSDPKKKRA